MTRPLIPLAVPNLVGAESEYLAECVRSTFVSSVGPFVGRFEGAVAAVAGAPLGVATSSGTTALQASLVAAGVRRDDLVIMPSLTFIATLSAVHWSGAEPWLMDVASSSWTLDPEKLTTSLALETTRSADGIRHRPSGKRIGAILPVYTLGTPADMDAICRIASHFELPVVADAAAALGATYKGRPLGALGAAASMISFNGNKTVTAGGGGVVVGNDDRVMRRVRHLTTTARVGNDYLHDEIGFNFRMTNLQAAVGLAQMEMLDDFVQKKKAIRKRYDTELAGYEGLASFPQPQWAESPCWFSGVVLEGRTEGEAARIIARLREASIDARPFWRPMHLQPAVPNALKTAMTITEDLWFRVLTLPCSTNLTDDDQTYVIDTVRRVVAA